ncbi:MULTISPECIES: GntR family transcriptional regulator [Streptomyces]|uniref:GntR family transcriptional regulator n=2 Tax=Streptomyces rimosus subsp. rimosus TaxID=132474 RepID=L8EGM0_STRR1|nr:MULTISPECIES: GntR family transcriptional regulator [Streptomyces]KOG72029.1 GntR family transcriptional regulator [Kitasatospora aureofaciens]MYT43958.1 FCD domain-containing protein [Streptomyces sp. SID5471]KEF03179.1 GntR family transcriptional regulator [Streptomyces rimosus]KOT35373.1 GntR family transcriptional regulator [Streptomyces rimosus subsp. rimosus]KOT38387.1 GntR family transcriptional regulator [Streptomyces sp. NRRL WC-3701]
MAGKVAKDDQRRLAEVSELAGDRVLLGRSSTAERVADILRDRITEGYFPPGARLSEESIGGALGVSRNTLREAFRLLTHERLLVHQLNRGVFVRIVTVADLDDIYRVRTLVECAAVRSLGEPPYPVGAMEAAVLAGETAFEERAWRDLGTANLRFHQAVVGLAGSPRMDELMRGVLAELRLVFHVMDDPRRFHAPYLTRNRQIIEALEAGEAAEAERLLESYLEDSRAQLSGAYAQRIAAR